MKASSNRSMRFGNDYEIEGFRDQPESPGAIGARAFKSEWIPCDRARTRRCRLRTQADVRSKWLRHRLRCSESPRANCNLLQESRLVDLFR